MKSSPRASWGFLSRPLLDLDRPHEWRGTVAYQGIILNADRRGGYAVCGHIHNSKEQAEECALRGIKMPWDLSDVTP